MANCKLSPRERPASDSIKVSNWFAEGEPCTGLFLVASGKIRIFKLSAFERVQVLAIEGPGSSFTVFAINILGTFILGPSHAHKEPMVVGVPVNIS
jgi:hypothetical protein